MSHPHAATSAHAHPAGHPAGQGGEKKYLPRLIAWETTRSCVLNCVHCRAAAKYGPYPGELSTEEAFAFLDDVKSFSDPIIILTGGEPMMRKDIYDIAKHGTGLGPVRTTQHSANETVAAAPGPPDEPRSAGYPVSD